MLERGCSTPRHIPALIAPFPPSSLYLHPGVRLLCFCKRHSAAAEVAMAQTPAPSRRPTIPPNETTATATNTTTTLTVTAREGPSGGCSREGVYNHALRRGHRAPEAVAAALAKRAFVRAVPYLVSEGCCSTHALSRSGALSVSGSLSGPAWLCRCVEDTALWVVCIAGR